jgi:hypothetical protein
VQQPSEPPVLIERASERNIRLPAVSPEREVSKFLFLTPPHNNNNDSSKQR